MIALLTFGILTIGCMIWSELDSIRIELKYMNTLKEKELKNK